MIKFKVEDKVMLLTIIIIVILSLIFLLLLIKYSKLSLVEGIFAITLVLIWPLTYKLIIRYQNEITNKFTK